MVKNTKYSKHLSADEAGITNKTQEAEYSLKTFNFVFYNL